MLINVVRTLCENLEALAIIATEKILASISAGPKTKYSELSNKSGRWYKRGGLRVSKN